jgi:hypothetical protein
MTFYVHYFYAADLMRKNSKRLEAKRDKVGLLSRNDRIDYRIYFGTWLGYLGVACETFRGLNIRLLLADKRPKEFAELIPEADKIGSKIKEHFDPLRKVRNSIFHLRSNADAIVEFIDHDERVGWAKQLHDELGKFLSSYRILCSVHYLMNDRLDEANDLIAEKRKSKQ